MAEKKRLPPWEEAKLVFKMQEATRKRKLLEKDMQQRQGWAKSVAKAGRRRRRSLATLYYSKDRSPSLFSTSRACSVIHLLGFPASSSCKDLSLPHPWVMSSRSSGRETNSPPCIA